MSAAMKYLFRSAPKGTFLYLTSALLLSACGNVDGDGDGFAQNSDCDDDNPLRYPGAPELCNGSDDDCDPETWFEQEGWDFDGDGSPVCADCDDDDPLRAPGAEPICASLDANCDGAPDGSGAAAGSSQSCAALDCTQILELEPTAADGSYWIHAGGITSFEVSCDMTSEGGGWIQLQIDDDDGVIVASYSTGNPWHKCDDDAASYYQGTSEGELAEDLIADTNFAHHRELRYRHPQTGETLNEDAVAALRSHITLLHPGSRMVATIGDNDGGNWQESGGGGHEVYVASDQGDWLLLTPGRGGDCGGGSWPSSGSETGFYLWASDSDDSAIAGDTNLDAPDWELGPTHILPSSVELIVFTGGGVSFGYEKQTFAVR
jgi:hypothetical protein